MDEWEIDTIQRCQSSCINSRITLFNINFLRESDAMIHRMDQQFLDYQNMLIDFSNLQNYIQ